MDNTKKTSVLGLGSALVDLLYHVSDDFLAGVPGLKGGTELVTADEMSAILKRIPSKGSIVQGGSAANTIVALAKLGTPTAMLAKIGDDSNGHFYQDALSEAGVQTAFFKVAPNLPTGRCLSLISPDSERTMRTCMAAAESMGPDDLDINDFTPHTHLYIEGYTLFNRKLLFKALDFAKEAGLEIHFDLAAPEVVRNSMDILPELLKNYASAVYANEMEAAALSGCANPLDALEYIAGICPLPIVKLGKKGAMLKSKGNVIQIPAKIVNAVDTTAAGDLWAAGFLHGYINGWPLENAAALASETAAAVVQVTGSVLPEDAYAALMRRASELANQH